MSPQPQEKLFDDIESFITESHTLIKGGELLQMVGLDDKVKLLCEQMLTLSAEDHARYADRMQHLLDGLQALSETMIEMRGLLAQDIRALSDHGKAHVAYRKVEASDRKKDEK